MRMALCAGGFAGRLFVAGKRKMCSYIMISEVLFMTRTYMAVRCWPRRWKCLKRINGEVPIFCRHGLYQQRCCSRLLGDCPRTRFWQPPFSIHVEYNGGASNSFSYNNAYLGGATYTWNNPDFTKGFTLTAMYKYIQKHREPNNFQLTGTWYVHFVKNGLCTFSGFADWWRERTDYADGSHRNFIFLAWTAVLGES